MNEGRITITTTTTITSTTTTTTNYPGATTISRFSFTLVLLCYSMLCYAMLCYVIAMGVKGWRVSRGLAVEGQGFGPGGWQRGFGVCRSQVRDRGSGLGFGGRGWVLGVGSWGWAWGLGVGGLEVGGWGSGAWRSGVGSGGEGLRMGAGRWGVGVGVAGWVLGETSTSPFSNLQPLFGIVLLLYLLLLVLLMVGLFLRAKCMAATVRVV